jgi:tetratricopeptide (TPR) repeat protein
VDELYARSGGTVPRQPYSFALALRGYALAKLGKRAQAEMVLQQLHGFGRERYIPPYHLALVLHALGRDDEALERLREAVEARDWFVIFLGTDPKWDDLRSTPAFDALLSRANLLEVSRAIKPELMSRSTASSK